MTRQRELESESIYREQEGWTRPVAAVRVPSVLGGPYRHFTRVITSQSGKADAGTLEIVMRLAQAGLV